MGHSIPKLEEPSSNQMFNISKGTLEPNQAQRTNLLNPLYDRAIGARVHPPGPMIKSGV
jgi:hypothetical protein